MNCLRQRGSLLIELALYAVAAVVVAGIAWKAWDSFKESIAKPYVDAQITADQIVVNKANGERDDALQRVQHAQADVDGCKTSLTAQNGAVAQWQATAAANKAEAQKAKAAALIANADKNSAIAENQRIARTKEASVKSCQDQLDGVAAKLREGARSRLPVAK